MDVKASARAKHASSQRGRARHSTRKQQPQQQQQAGKDATPSSDKPAPSLPSNWSRYEEDDDLPLDDRLADVPAIKSKGANYRDLLAEKSMFQAPDLARGRKALMAARGRDIWARLRDVDNVWNVSGEEDNFFTLDLDFLAQELETIDIAERLFIDPKYISCEETEDSESVYKDSRTERGKNETETGSSRPGRSIPEVAGLGEAAVSVLSKESDTSQNSPATVHKDGGIEETVTLSISRDPSVHSSQHKKLEVSDGKLPQLHSKIRRDLKDTLAELPKITNDRFEPKSAEAELDALLDMLDNECTGKASNLLSSAPLGYGKSTGSAAQKSPDDNSQQEDRLVDTSMGSSAKLMVGTADDSSLAMKRSDEVGVKVDNVLSRVMTVGSKASVQRSSEGSMKNVPCQGSDSTNVSNVPDLDEDFDNWLDSL